MKNKLKYTLIFLFMFVTFIPFLNADDVINKVEGDTIINKNPSSQYRFSCSYDVIIKNTNGEEVLPLEVLVYRNRAELSLNKVEISNKMRGNSISDKLSNWPFYVDVDNYFNLATETGDACPDVTFGTRASRAGASYVLLFNTEKKSTPEEIYIDARKNTSKPVYNPNLDPSEIIKNPNDAISECTYYYDGGLKMLEDYYSFTFKSLGNGKKLVAVKKVDSNGEQTDYYNDGAILKIGGVNVKIASGEESELFDSKCLKKLYFVEDVTSTSRSPLLLVTSNKDLADERGKNGSQYSSTITDTPIHKPGEGEDNSTSRSGFCTTYLGSVNDEGDNIAKFLDQIYTVIKIGSIVLVIVLSMIEFAGVVTSNKDELMPVVKKFSKRLIILIIILMLPTFIDLFGNLIGIEDILCGIK